MDNQSQPSRLFGSTPGTTKLGQSSTSTSELTAAASDQLARQDEEGLLQLHKRRQTLGTISSLETLDYTRLKLEWYSIYAAFLIISEKIAGRFETGAFFFVSKDLQDKVTEVIRSAPETNRIRWNIYPLLTEFKMPESVAHGTAGSEITHILRSTILRTLYIPGTSDAASRLRSPASSCIYIHMDTS